ncbi:hypothetical protein KAW64_02755, partial [bacterium]|nr:hypothetical protein [bacterium]
MRRDIAGGEKLASEAMRCRAGARRRRQEMVLVLAVLVAAGLCGARDPEQEPGPQDGAALRSGGMIWITVDADLLVLNEEIALPPLEGVPVPPALQGSLAFGVASPLPNWVVRAQFEPTTGPGGPIDVGCVMVRSPATGEEFVSIAGGPIIAEGHGPAPVPELWLELRVRPEWTDEVGTYEGLLHLTPVGSPGHYESEIEPPGALRGVPGGGGGAGTSLGPRVTVPVTMTVGALTVVMISETEFNIETGLPPGRYYVEPDLGVVLATNEGQWELHLEGTPFVSGDDEIPFERLEWSRLGPDGEPGPWTSLGESNCIMSGYDERGVFPATFRLALDVTMGNRAGDYVCQ